MIEFKKKIKVSIGWNIKSLYAMGLKVGEISYDKDGKRWEVGEDVNFSKFWFREVK